MAQSMQSVREEDILIPLRWVQYLGYEDEDRLPQLTAQFCAMVLGFKNYKKQLEDALYCLQYNRELTDTERFHWVFNKPDLENDEVFYQQGTNSHDYNTVLLKLNPLSSDYSRLLDENIHSCHYCKTEIKALLQKLKWHQRESHYLIPTEMERTEEMRQFCKGNIQTLKGLLAVTFKLENELKSMQNSLQLPPETDLQNIIEDTEKLKSFADVDWFQISLPHNWTQIDYLYLYSLTRISPDIVNEYRRHLLKARGIVKEMKNVRRHRQMDAGNSPHGQTSADQAFTSECRNIFEELFIKWKGMRVILERLEDVDNRCTRNFSMEIEQSEEELNYKDHTFLYRLGEGIRAESPTKWKNPTTHQGYKRIIEDITKDLATLQETVERRIKIFDEKRRKRQEFQRWHQRWKGLVLINRTLKKEEEQIHHLGSTITKPTEEETHVEDEVYISKYADQHPKPEGNDESSLEMKPICAEHEFERTLTEYQQSSINLMAENKEVTKTLSFKRKGIQVGILQSSFTDVSDNSHSGNPKPCFKCNELLERLLIENKQNIDRLIEDHNEEKRIWEEEKLDLTRLQSQTWEKGKESRKMAKINAELKESIEQQQQAYKSKELELFRYKQYVAQTNNDIVGLKQMLHDSQEHITNLEAQKNRAQKHAQNLEVEKEKLLTRLSKIAGTKLTQGNAAITDLSDPDRPMKIAEKYSELYDNEWTDALEELIDSGSNDDEGIALLLGIVKEAYTFCIKVVQEYQEQMLQSVTCLPTIISVGMPLVQNQDQMSRQPQEGSYLSEHEKSPVSQSLENNLPPLSKNAVQLTEEQKRDLDDLKKALLPQMFHQVQKRNLSIDIQRKVQDLLRE